MHKYRAEVHRTEVIVIEFEAIDDDEADCLMSDASWIDDMIGDLDGMGVGVQHFGATRIEDGE